MPVSEAISKRVYVVCPNCGSINVAMRTLGFWSSPLCPTCKKKINIRDFRRSSVTCDNCGNVILYNALTHKPEICPCCQKQLINPLDQRHFWQVPCPKCGTEVTVQDAKGSVQCPICDYSFDIQKAREKRKQQESIQPILIEYGANNQDILWKHPQNSFPRGSRLIVKEGTAAILLENGKLCRVADPGEYLLEDKSLSLSQKLRNASGDWVYLTDIYFVQKHIAAEYKWGTAYPAEVRDGYGTYTVMAHGSLRLRVIDPHALAEHLNFSDVTIQGIYGFQNAQESTDLIANLVVQQVGMSFGEPFQALINQQHWTLRTFVKTDLQSRIQPAINGLLAVFGLELQPNTFSIYDLSLKETDQSRKERELTDTIQKTVVWSAGELRIHMKDDPAKYASFSLEGSVQPVIIDRQLFLDSSLCRNLLSSESSMLDFKNQINRLLRDLFTQILQPMVNDTDADIRELGPYYTYLKSTTSECLGFAMKHVGLAFENITFEQKSFEPSTALSSMVAHEGTMSAMLDDEKMRRFTQRIKLVENQETGEYDLQNMKIEVEFGEKAASYKEILANLRQKDLLRDEREKKETMASESRIASLQFDNDLIILRRKQEHELVQEEHKVNMRDMLHKIDQSDLNWTEKLDEYARIRTNLGFQDNMEHEVMQAQTQQKAGHFKIQYTAEEKELEQEIEDRDAKREEAKKRAEYEREMQMLREYWEREARLCQLESSLFKYQFEIDYLSKVDYNRVSFENAKAAAEREYAERLRIQKERDDTSFLSRCNDLIGQIRAFKTELEGSPADIRNLTAKMIPTDLIKSLLASLNSVVASISTAKTDTYGTISTTTTSTTKSHGTNGSSYSPPKINPETGQAHIDPPLSST